MPSDAAILLTVFASVANSLRVSASSSDDAVPPPQMRMSGAPNAAALCSVGKKSLAGSLFWPKR